MAIRPPSWCANAVPTPAGWVDPKTKELLKAIKIKDHLISEWKNANSIVVDRETRENLVEFIVSNEAPEPVVAEEEPEIMIEESLFEFEDVSEEVLEEEMVHEENMQMLNEAPANDKSLDEMTKLELEALGRQHGIELDRREKKATLIERMKSLLG